MPYTGLKSAPTHELKKLVLIYASRFRLKNGLDAEINLSLCLRPFCLFLARISSVIHRVTNFKHHSKVLEFWKLIFNNKFWETIVSSILLFEIKVYVKILFADRLSVLFRFLKLSTIVIYYCCIKLIALNIGFDLSGEKLSLNIYVFTCCEKLFIDMPQDYFYNSA